MSLTSKIMNMLTLKRLCRYVIGTAHQPEELQERGRSFYKVQMLNSLSDKELEEHEDAIKEWLQKENEPTTATVWKKLTSIYANKGIIFETDLLMRLQTPCYIKGDDMCKHLTDLTSLKECLTEIGSPLSDKFFASYICTSLSLAPSYRPLFTTLATAARKKEKPTMSNELKWHLLEEANSAELKKNMNKSNSVMLAAHARFRVKGKRKSKDSHHCSNCNKDGHTIDQCFEEGREKAGDAPEWWVQKHGNKSKEKEKAKSANVTDKVKKDDKIENYAFLTLTIDTPSDDENINVALYVTLPLGMITKPMPPLCLLPPEPIHAADGCIFSAIGKEELCVQLPMKNGEKSTLILLKKVYYAPQMAFTLISVSCLHRAGYFLYIKDGMCITCSPKLQQRIIGCVSELRGLYCADSSTVSSSPQLNINLASKEAVHLGMITGIELDMTSEPEFCKPCIKGKATRHSFPKESETEYTKYDKKVVADLWGPAQIKSLGGAKYYYLNFDKYSHEEYVDFLHHNAAEHSNRTHVKGAHTIMIAAGLPKYLWAEAIRHYVWLQNHTLMSALPGNITPYERATTKKPNLSIIQEWSAIAYIKHHSAGSIRKKAFALEQLTFPRLSQSFPQHLKAAQSTLSCSEKV
ncbi:Retrovirus-related Pol polyprotein from transposon TNT 1-94 [Hypsizygus marmoreus]|uniref:Retrovirus-related Pol polyprotein from transposon TNT 1-94 n=1 Tax=Hypsizygus marmoreus TaxID=39966 RepID=A0A369KAW8_HYPMA|nr:Retrovirus-related Pol polyprotein from transposon TNT 1-94 [Hypsizygus marmoreus]